MANHITNKLKISGEESLVVRIKKEIASVDEEGTELAIDFEIIHPIPNEFENESNKWRIENWGTKWNAYESMYEGDLIYFLTAWSNPFELMIKLSENYPDAEFNLRYADENFGYNVGEYTMKNGEIIYDDIPKGGTPDAYLMAGEIYDPTYIACRIEEMEPEDLNEGWGMNYIKAAYKGKIIGDYQKFVFDALEKLAVEEEDYEMAQKIKEHIEANKV